MHSELMLHLEAAQSEVLKMLVMGSFPRFLKSPLYSEYMANYSKSSELSRAEMTRHLQRK
jgi:hypothetical protein